MTWWSERKNLRLQELLAHQSSLESEEHAAIPWDEAAADRVWRRLQSRMPSEPNVVRFWPEWWVAFAAAAFAGIALVVVWPAINRPSDQTLKSGTVGVYVHYPRLFGARLASDGTVVRLDNFGMLRAGDQLIFGTAMAGSSELKMSLHVRQPDGSMEVLLAEVPVPSGEGYLNNASGYFSVRLSKLGVYTFSLVPNTAASQFLGEAADAQFQVRVED